MKCNNNLYICGKNGKEKIAGYSLFGLPQNELEKDCKRYKNFLRIEECGGNITVDCYVFIDSYYYGHSGIETLEIKYICDRCNYDHSNNFILPRDVYSLGKFLQNYIDSNEIKMADLTLEGNKRC